MIHFWMKDRLAEAAPGIRWGVNTTPDVATSVSVFEEGGGHPALYEIRLEYPAYMVWVESMDMGMAEYLAQLVYDTLHNYHREHPETLVQAQYEDEQGNLLGSQMVVLKSINAASPPNPIGKDDKGRMQYSINFETTIERRGKIA